jgi:hypothetical protein
MWKNRVFEEPSRISIAFSDYFLVYSKNVFNVKVCCSPDQNPSNKQCCITVYYITGLQLYTGAAVVVKLLSENLEYMFMGCYG